MFFLSKLILFFVGLRPRKDFYLFLSLCISKPGIAPYSVHTEALSVCQFYQFSIFFLT